MKYKYLVLLILIFSLFGCSKNNNQNIKQVFDTKLDNSNDSTQISNEDSFEKNVILFEANIPCVLFYDSTNVYIENNEGNLDFFDLCLLGQDFLAYPSNSEKIGEEVITKIFQIDDKSENFTKVVYKNENCWISSQKITPYSYAGIILDTNTLVYDSLDESNSSSIIAPQFQVVAINTNYKSQTDEVFSKISFRCEEENFNNYFVKTEKISKNPNDIKAFQLLNRAAISNDVKIKNEILSNCLELEVSDIMKEKIIEDTENILLEFIPEEED